MWVMIGLMKVKLCWCKFFVMWVFRGECVGNLLLGVGIMIGVVLINVYR